ncbi:hypothetical protein LPC08_20895 [Roseomonas sp. OT10]|uniref:hypothetical protein n=1 Tax=Roseomonas cutis TaxID=2897332 RepID=UPI001E4799F1|nr:hypothetical protein [Roseomonas sp. OT10]UFN48446.1 hypothetical protein LPC08_20895 [Roseomonas sp. OT10]
MTSRRLLLATCAALALGTGFGSLARSVAQAAEPAVVEDRVTLLATVETIDMATRTVLLRSLTGGLLTVKAGPEVRNLAQVRPGDRVTVDYYQAVAVQMGAPGSAPPPTVDSGEYRAALGERPAAGAYEATSVRVTVVSIDRATYRVSFLDPGNNLHTVAVRAEPMRNFVRALRPGDQVDIHYVEELAVSIEPAAR